MSKSNGREEVNKVVNEYIDKAFNFGVAVGKGSFKGRGLKAPTLEQKVQAKNRHIKRQLRDEINGPLKSQLFKQLKAQEGAYEMLIKDSYVPKIWVEEIIALSDEIELSAETTLEEWKAFKRFRNTLRERYLTKLHEESKE